MEWEGNGKSHTLYLQGILFAECQNMIDRDVVLDICFLIKNRILVTFKEMGGGGGSHMEKLGNTHIWKI